MRFISGASKEYLAKIRKKRGAKPRKTKAKGGGLKRKGLGQIAVGAAGLGYGAYTGTLGTNAGATIESERKIARGVRKARGGNLRAKGRANVKRRVRGAGLSLHNKATVKFRAKGVKSKTEMGF